MTGDAVRITLLVTGILEKLAVPYAVGGSLSSSVHGVMRATMDVDIIADLRREQIPDFIQALGSAFYTDEQMISDAIEHRSSFNLIHLETAYKVDVFIPKNRLFDTLQIQRSTLTCVSSEDDAAILVTSPEDIILAKLEWYRLGDEVSDRQWRDALGVLHIKRGTLDIEYLKDMSKNLGIADLLEKLLNEEKD